MTNAAHTTAIANRVLLRVLTEVGGVDTETLDLLVQFKNALVEDCEGVPTGEWTEDVYRQLTKMANPVK